MGESAFEGADKTIPVYVPAEALSSYQNHADWSVFTNLQAIVTEFTVGGLTYKVTDQIAKTVEIIGYTTGLPDVLDIPATVTNNGINYNVTSIGADAIWGIDDLTEVSIPNSITTIGENVFWACYYMTKVTIGSGVTSIGAGAFALCEGLTEMTVLATMPPTLGDDAFGGVNRDIPVYVPAESLAAYQAAEVWKDFNLQAIGSAFTVGNLRYEVTDKTAETVTVTGYVNTPEGALEIPSTVEHKGTTYSVTSIGVKAFYDCTGLTSLTLPASLTNIETYALYNCSGLTKMTVFATTPPTVEGGAFYNISKETPVYVPAASLAAYQASVWKGFTNLQAIKTALNTPSMPESIRIQGGMLHNPQQLHLTLYDMQGRQVYSGNDNTVSQPAGVYVLRCNGASGKVLF